MTTGPHETSKRSTVVLFMTHKWDALHRLRFERLQREIGDFADVVILMQKSDISDAVVAECHGLNRPIVVFDTAMLPRRLGYPYAFDGAFVPGSLHFALLAFAQRVHYEYYLLIENDVDFSGNWGDMVTSVVAAAPDFASLHFHTAEQKPDWGWWELYRPGQSDADWGHDRANLRRSFNPVYCLSRHAVELLHAAHRDGWIGHQEMILPTILAHRGCKLLDLGGADGFCTGREQDARLARSANDVSTVRFRPNVTPEEFLSRSTGRTLFHPVKDAWYFDGTQIVSVDPA